MSYQNQTAWQKIQNFLPTEYQLTTSTLPKEEYWQWHGNQIHLDTYRNTQAPAKVILFHGVGTNGRQMTTILGHPLSLDGFEVVSIDMPLYGETKVGQPTSVSYDDWVQCGSDYIDYELGRDSRPIFLYGLSAGGMETYHIAAKNKKVQGIIGMTFLDQRSHDVRMTTTNNAFWGTYGTALSQFSTYIGLGNFKMKMSIPSKMTALVNDPGCLKEMMADSTSAGAKVSLKFMASYMTYTPEIDPEDFDICPIILTQPEADRWTPQRLSDSFLKKITHVSVEKVVLKSGSHYPIEEEALVALHQNVRNFINHQLEN